MSVLVSRMLSQQLAIAVCYGRAAPANLACPRNRCPSPTLDCPKEIAVLTQKPEGRRSQSPSPSSCRGQRPSRSASKDMTDKRSVAG